MSTDGDLLVQARGLVKSFDRRTGKAIHGRGGRPKGGIKKKK